MKDACFHRVRRQRSLPQLQNWDTAVTIHLLQLLPREQKTLLQTCQRFTDSIQFTMLD